MTVVIDMEIASADRYRLYLDQDFIILHLGLRNLPNFNQPFSFSIFHHCFHLISFWMRRPHFLGAHFPFPFTFSGS